jgi:hypothetical protein
MAPKNVNPRLSLVRGGQTFRLRFGMTRQAISSQHNFGCSLHESYNGGTFTRVGLSTGTKTIPTKAVNYEEGDEVTQQLDPSGVWPEHDVRDDGQPYSNMITYWTGDGTAWSTYYFWWRSDGAGGEGQVDTYMETEFAITLPPGAMGVGDTIEYRVYQDDDNIFLRGYNEVPVLGLRKDGCRIGGG